MAKSTKKKNTKNRAGEPTRAEGVPEPVESDETPLPESGESAESINPNGEASPVDFDIRGTVPTPERLAAATAEFAGSPQPDHSDHVRVELYRGATVRRVIAHRNEADALRAEHLADRKGRPEVVLSRVAKAGDRVCVTSRGSLHATVYSVVGDEAILELPGGNATNVPLAECAVASR